jgi:hypothetical protein
VKESKLNKTESGLWNEEEIEFLRTSMDLSLPEIAKQLGRPFYSVRTKLRSLGLKKLKPYSGLDDNFIRENYYTLSWDEIAIYLGRSKGSVCNRSRKLGLEDPNRNIIIQRIAHNWYTYDTAYFDRPTVENSYWGGFIAADGNITRSKRSCNVRLRIGLSSKDHAHLKRFSDDISYTGPIRLSYLKGHRYNGRWVKPAEVATIEISIDEGTFIDLKRHFSIVPAKSLILDPPSLTEDDLVLAYIAGYLDGDGSLLKKYPKNNRSWLLDFTGTVQLLEFIRNKFDFWFPPCRLSSAKVNMRGKSGRYCVYGDRAIFIANAMLKLNIPRLVRKWDPYINYKSKILEEQNGIQI